MTIYERCILIHATTKLGVMNDITMCSMLRCIYLALLNLCAIFTRMLSMKFLHIYIIVGKCVLLSVLCYFSQPSSVQ